MKGPLPIKVRFLYASPKNSDKQYLWLTQKLENQFQQVDLQGVLFMYSEAAGGEDPVRECTAALLSHNAG